MPIPQLTTVRKIAAIMLVFPYDVGDALLDVSRFCGLSIALSLNKSISSKDSTELSLIGCFFVPRNNNTITIKMPI